MISQQENDDIAKIDQITARLSLNSQPFDNLSIYNLVQVFPNNVIYDFDFTEAALVPNGAQMEHQLSKQFSIQRQQSLIQSEIMSQLDTNIVKVHNKITIFQKVNINKQNYDIKFVQQIGLKASLCNYVESSSKFSFAASSSITSIQDKFSKILGSKGQILQYLEQRQYQQLIKNSKVQSLLQNETIQIKLLYDQSLPLSKENLVENQLCQLFEILNSAIGLILSPKNEILRNFYSQNKNEINCASCSNLYMSDSVNILELQLLVFIQQYIRSIDITIFDGNDSSEMSYEANEKQLSFALTINDQPNLNIEDIQLLVFIINSIILPHYLTQLPKIYNSESEFFLLDPTSVKIQEYIKYLKTEFNLSINIELINLAEDSYNFNFLSQFLISEHVINTIIEAISILIKSGTFNAQSIKIQLDYSCEKKSHSIVKMTDEQLLIIHIPMVTALLNKIQIIEAVLNYNQQLNSESLAKAQIIQESTQIFSSNSDIALTFEVKVQHKQQIEGTPFSIIIFNSEEMSKSIQQNGVFDIVETKTEIIQIIDGFKLQKLLSDQNQQAVTHVKIYFLTNVLGQFIYASGNLILKNDSAMIQSTVYDDLVFSLQEQPKRQLNHNQLLVLLSGSKPETIFQKCSISVIVNEQKVKYQLKSIQLAYLQVYTKTLTNNDVLLCIFSKRDLKVEIDDGNQVKEYQFASEKMFDLIQTKTLKSVVKDAQEIDLKAEQEELKVITTKYDANDKEKNTKVSSYFKYFKGQNVQGLLLDEIKPLNFDIPKDVEKILITQNNELFTIPENQYDKVSSAGQSRKEKIVFFDSDNNKTSIGEDQLSSLKIKFLNQRNPQIQFEGTIIDYKNEILYVEWTPIIKGNYDLYVNDTRIYFTFNPLSVISGPAFMANCKIQIAEENIFNYHQKIGGEIILRDKFNNIYTGVDHKILNKQENLVKINIEENSEELEIKITEIIQQINEFGILQIGVSITTQKAVETLNEEQPLTLIFNFLEEVIKKTIKLKGISFEQRRIKFLEQIAKEVKKSSGFNFRPNRWDFLNSLLKFEDLGVRSKFSVNYVGEEGSDAGGLTREFYKLVGSCFQDPTTNMFDVTPNGKIFFHKNIGSIERVGKYIRALAILLGNSIINNQLIGVEFATPLLKVLMNYQVEVNDMKDILEEKVYQRYEDLHKVKQLKMSFLQLTDEEIECLEIYFTASEGQDELELKPEGKNIQVKRENLNEFLHLTAQYLTFTKYEEYYKIFREGFVLALPLEVLNQWVLPLELTAFTLGQKDLSYETINSVLSCEGSSALTQWFRQFLQSADLEILKGFLAFSSGASSIPFDISNYRIRVQFIGHMKTNHLPIAHTCFNSIEVPNYKSYETMAIKLRAAFLYGAQGFSFA